MLSGKRERRRRREKVPNGNAENEVSRTC